MKEFLAFWFFLLLFVSANAQTVSGNAGTATNVASAGDRPWLLPVLATGAANGFSTFANVNNGNSETNYLTLTNFGFTLPSNAIIRGIAVSLLRNANNANQISDLEIRLIKGGSIQSASNKAAGGTWPVTLTPIGYGGATDLWNNSWVRTDIQDVGFGLAVRADKTGGGGPVIALIDAVVITVYYDISTPIHLSRFEVEKTNSDQVEIKWSTEYEESVKFFQILKSMDGNTFKPLYTIAPKGGINQKMDYQVTDISPLPGLNFYRLYEMDLDGKEFYFQIRQINIKGSSQRFKALNTGSGIRLIVNVNPGKYTVTVIQTDGSIVIKQILEIDKNKYAFDIPYGIQKPGIYYIHLSGKDTKETEKLYIGNH